MAIRDPGYSPAVDGGGYLGSIGAGLGAALCLGVGDYLARHLTVAHGWRRAVWLVQLWSLVPVTIAALLVDGPPALSGRALALAVGLGVSYSIGIVALYRGLARGPISLVSPIASTFAVVTVGLSACFGRAPTPMVLVGLAVATAGVVVAAAPRERGTETSQRPGSGVVWALVSSLSFGATFYAIAGGVATLGVLWPLVGIRITCAGLLSALVAGERRPLQRPAGSVAVIAVAVAALDSGGVILYTIGTTLGHVAVVAVLSSLFAVVTVILAQLRMRERLAAWQWVGVVLVLAGVAWTSAAGH